MPNVFDMKATKAAIMSGAVKMDQLTSTLEDLRLYAYSYLYSLQKDIVGFHKIHLKYEDLDSRPDIAFTNIRINQMMQHSAKISFVHHTKRLRFRRSKFYNVPLTNLEVRTAKDLFIYNFFVMIDGAIDLSAKVICREELTLVCLRAENMSSSVREKFKPGCSIDIIFLPDLKIEALSASKYDLMEADLTFTTAAKLTEKNSVIAFVGSGEGLVKAYRPEVVGEDVIIPECSVEEFSDEDVIDVTIIILPNFLETHTLGIKDRYISTKTMPMPIPPENTLVWANNEDGSVSLDTQAKIEKKYPNIFEFEKDHFPMCVDVFYWDNSANSHMEYKSEAGIYCDMVDILSKYTHGGIHPYLKEFAPIVYKYGVPDFHNKGYDDVKANELKYKINKMFDTYKVWAFASQLYYEKVADYYRGYVINTKKLNMASKLRTNTELDVDKKENFVEFNEEMYVFIFSSKASYTPLPYKFWVDGVRVVPEHRVMDGSYEYVYLPKRYFKEEGSFVEIERSNDVTGKITVRCSTSGTEFALEGLTTVCWNIPALAMFVTTMDGEIIPEDKYHFTVMIGKDENVIPSGSTLRLTKDSKLKLYFHDEDMEGTKVRVQYNESPMELNCTVEVEKISEKNLNKSNTIQRIPPYTNRIRIFKDGRLIPSDRYNIQTTGNIKPWNISLKGYGYIGNFQVDYIPEGYNQVYYQALIDRKGIVDLTGKIDKPFSLKYFDVYLNGYRLTPNQVEKVTDFVIDIQNVNSLNDLYIYERESTTNGMFVLEKEDTKSFLAEQLYADDERFIETLKTHLKTITPDINIDDIDDYENALEIIANSIIGFVEVNHLFAEENLPDEFISKYMDFFGREDVFFIDANKIYPMERPDYIFYIAPRRKDEYEKINRWRYMDEFNDMLAMFANKIIDANGERNKELGYKVKTVMEMEGDNSIGLIGNFYSARWGTRGVNLLGMFDCLKDVVLMFGENNPEKRQYINGLMDDILSYFSGYQYKTSEEIKSKLEEFFGMLDQPHLIDANASYSLITEHPEVEPNV